MVRTLPRVRLAGLAARASWRSVRGPGALTTRSQGRSPRLLVLIIGRADETALDEMIATRAGGGDLLVVVPALHSPFDIWGPDAAAARRAATRHVQESVESLQRRGLRARGMVGPASPLRALADAVDRFEPDRLLIASSPGGRANSFARDVAAAAATRFGLVVDEVALEHLDS